MDAQIRTSFAINGRTYEGTVTVEGLYPIPLQLRLNAAKTGALTTRTDDNTGTLTMTTGHGIITGNRLDVYWEIAGVKGCRRGMTVGTVAVDSVPIDGGAGDVLPADESDITAMVPTEISVGITGGSVQAFVISGQKGVSVVFTETGGTLIYGKSVLEPSAIYSWYEGSDVTNPLTTGGGAIGKVYLSHGDSYSAANVGVCVLTN